jgi:hypothetical protein
MLELQKNGSLTGWTDIKLGNSIVAQFKGNILYVRVDNNDDNYELMQSVSEYPLDRRWIKYEFSDKRMVERNNKIADIKKKIEELKKQVECLEKGD